MYNYAGVPVCGKWNCKVNGNVRFHPGKDNPVFEQALSDFKEYYAEHCHDKTAPYPGVLALLQNLKKKGVKMAVVSNKGGFAVKELNAGFIFRIYWMCTQGEMEEMGTL